MGGKTNATGEVDKPDNDPTPAETRREQGYGGANDMDRTIGA